MLEVQICVGSSCHMKGSYPIIRMFEGWIRQYGLEDRVLLKAAFCLGECTRGVAIRVDGEPVTGLSIGNAEEIFHRQVLDRLGIETGGGTHA